MMSQHQMSDDLFVRTSIYLVLDSLKIEDEVFAVYYLCDIFPGFECGKLKKMVQEYFERYFEGEKNDKSNYV